MIENLLLIGLTALYLITFITRNIIVKKRIGQPVRARDPLLKSSIVCSTLCFLCAILSAHDNVSMFMGKLTFLKTPYVTYAGFLFFCVSIIWGWVISAQLKNSWRVGVMTDQKTTLIEDGIYAYVRNPYFISYFIMYMSLFLIRPSVVLLILVMITVAIFHKMVLKEESYLSNIHGKAYEKYRDTTGRYFPTL